MEHLPWKQAYPPESRSVHGKRSVNALPWSQLSSKSNDFFFFDKKNVSMFFSPFQGPVGSYSHRDR